MLRVIDEYFDPVGHGCRIHQNAQDCAAHLVERYLAYYTGALFDPRRDEPWWHPDHIAASDLFSVAALSLPKFARPSFLNVVVPILDADADASASCVPGCSKHVRCLLQSVPASASIFSSTASVHLDRMNDIWNLIRSNPTLVSTRALGDAGISKTLARKRPALVPITDSIARARALRANGESVPKCIWCFTRIELQSTKSLPGAVSAVRRKAGVPEWMTDLRVIDVVVWMRDCKGCK